MITLLLLNNQLLIFIKILKTPKHNKKEKHLQTEALKTNMIESKQQDKSAQLVTMYFPPHKTIA